MLKDGKMPEIEEEPFEFEGFLALVMEINGNNNVVCQPVFRIKVAPRAGSQGVAYLSLRAVSVPGFAEGLGRNAGELIQFSSTLTMDLNSGRDSYVEQSISSWRNSEGRVWLGYDGQFRQRGEKADDQVFIAAVPALPFEFRREILTATFFRHIGKILLFPPADSPLIMAAEQGKVD